MKTYFLEDVLPFVKESYQIKGKKNDISFINLRPVLQANSGSLVFIDSKKQNKDTLAKNTKAKIIICDEALKINSKLLKTKCFLVVDNPRLTFARIGNKLFTKNPRYGIHPASIIHKGAKINKKTHIGPFCYIGKSIIGEGTIIYGHCHIGNNVIIGKNVIIKAGCVIGSEGFGYVKNKNKEREKFPQIGGVIIEDNVEIGANNCIDRGALGSTLIKSGTKLDNLIHVGHNALIGKNCLITANVMMAGSVVVGDGTYIAPSVSIIDHVQIGKKSFIGMGSIVTKNVPDGEIWIGSPARPLNEFKKIQKKLNKLL